MNASERIREALQKSEAARKSHHTATAAATEAAAPEPAVPETPAAARETLALQETADVETTLPLLGASDHSDHLDVARPEPRSSSSAENADRKSKAAYLAVGTVLALLGLAAFLLKDRLFAPKGSPPTVQAATQTAAPVQPRMDTAGTTAPVTEAPPPVNTETATVKNPAPDPAAAKKAETVPNVAKPEKTKIAETPPPPEPRSFTPPPVPRQTVESPAILLDPSSGATPVGSPIQTATGLPQMANRAPAPPPPKPVPAAPLKVGGKVQPPALIHRVAPVYPAIAKNAHVEGMLRFTAMVGKDGRVHDIQFVSGPRLLVQAATDALKQWVYRPSLLNGEPVEMVTQIDLQFTLGQ